MGEHASNVPAALLADLRPFAWSDPSLPSLGGAGHYNAADRVLRQPHRPRVQLESPYAGDVEANVAYARSCLRDCLERGEAPFASHLLYTQPGVLRDEDPSERRWGIESGLEFLVSADRVAVYVDRGVTAGMLQGIRRAVELGRQVHVRSLAGWSPRFLVMLLELLGLSAQVNGYQVTVPRVAWLDPQLEAPPLQADVRWFFEWAPGEWDDPPRFAARPR